MGGVGGGGVGGVGGVGRALRQGRSFCLCMWLLQSREWALGGLGGRWLGGGGVGGGGMKVGMEVDGWWRAWRVKGRKEQHGGGPNRARGGPQARTLLHDIVTNRRKQHEIMAGRGRGGGGWGWVAWVCFLLLFAVQMVLMGWARISPTSFFVKPRGEVSLVVQKQLPCEPAGHSLLVGGKWAENEKK